MARISGNPEHDAETVIIRSFMNMINIMDGYNFTSKMTLLFIIFIILSITSTESQENQINVGQKTTISALKFTGNFHITYKAIFPQIII